MKFTLQVPPNFSFWRTVYSHGWCSLPPFDVRKDDNHLRRLFVLPAGKILAVEISQPAPSHLTLSIPSDQSLNLREKRDLLSQVKICFRLDEDYSTFYAEAKRHPQYRWIPREGAGRLLRAPTVFEDVIKMICTTNCSWALTELMVGNLCSKLGYGNHDSEKTFPNPEAIAVTTEKFLRKEIRAGYRAPYLLELSKRILKGEIDPETWRSSDLPAAELFEQVRSVKGIGPYAAGNILKLLGRYDYLGIDSWCRKKFSEIHRNGRKTNDRVIERYYEPFGQWRGLFFWLDVTKHWYEKKFPF